MAERLPRLERGDNRKRRACAATAALEVVQTDLATTEVVNKLYGKINWRPVAALLANAGRGLGKGFLDQDFDAARYVLHTNVTGTIYLIRTRS